MADTPAASLSFLSHVRQGLATGAASGEGRLKLPIRLRVTGATAREIDVPVELHGPGDITGLDPREVVRTEPAPMATDFEPNYFPAIEFYRPDLPWMFSPKPSDTAGHLHPWICLVTVRKDACSLDPGVPLPVLTCPRRELSDPDEAWAWAHAQVARRGTQPESTLGELLRADPARSVSRLLSPRRLDAQTSYYACLVPVYDVGRKAGLDEPITSEDEKALGYAWAPDAAGETSIRLPVYYHWEFRTGVREDFEALATRLQQHHPPPTLGLRPMDIREPGWTLPALPAGLAGTVVGLEGALRALQTVSTPWPPETRVPFQEGLRRILNAPADQAPPDGAEAPIVMPPIYGQWYPGAARVPEANDEPRWLADLNLDPRYRVAAGMGASVVRFEQEPLMAAAWEQLDAHELDEWTRKRKELSHEVGETLLERHFAPLRTERLAQVIAPIHLTAEALRMPTTPANGEGDRGRDAARTLVAEALAPHPDVTRFDATLSAAFRRLRRHVRDGSDDTRETAAAHLSVESETAERAETEEGAPAPELRMPDRRKETLLATLGPTTPALPGTIVTLEMNGLRTTIASEAPGQGETPVRFAPRFTTPMYEALRDYFPEALLPGMEQVPPNTLTLLKTNPMFVEAFLVGLNHEMSRELLWRGYPVDRRGTFFRHFWDTRALLTGVASPEAEGDISPIRDWEGPSRLGGHITGSTREAEGRVVLLVRGDLLRRYPRALIYAVKAGWADGSGRRKPLTGPENEEYPMFRATRAPDITLLGFRLTEEDVLGAPDPASREAGWFFVLQEQPTEPRFGFDEATSYGEEAPENWGDLTWGHLAPDEEALKSLVYIPLTGALRDPRPTRAVRWGENGAHMAYITQQKPFRIAIHARVWLRQDETP